MRAPSNRCARDTSILHFAHPVSWFGFGPIIFGQPRRITARARSPVWLARVSQVEVRELLNERPEWWPHFLQPAHVFGEVFVGIAADLLIRDNERRCAVVLLWQGGRRLAGPEDRRRSMFRLRKTSWPAPQTSRSIPPVQCCVALRRAG